MGPRPCWRWAPASWAASPLSPPWRSGWSPTSSHPLRAPTLPRRRARRPAATPWYTATPSPRWWPSACSGRPAALLPAAAFLGSVPPLAAAALGLVTDPLAPPEATDPAASPRPAARRYAVVYRYAVAALVAVGMLGAACAAWWLGFALTSS